MAKIEVVHPDRDSNFVTGAYSDGVISNGMLYISGQAATDYKQSRFLLGTIEEETRLTLDNIKTIIESVGATMEDVVKCTVHLADIEMFDRYNAVYATYFTGIKPARTTVQSTLAENLKVEIDCIVDLNQ